MKEFTLLGMLLMATHFCSAQAQHAPFSTEPRAYPNPVTGKLVIELPVDSVESYQFYLLNVEGQVVRAFTDLRNSRLEVPLPDLQPGIYLYEIRTHRSFFGRIIRK
ncbi:MAG: T9SS type A sorting domain-containing protein [Bacteroidota bacterium]